MKLQCKKKIEDALNEYFGLDPTPAEAKDFLLKIRQDIDIMLWAIEEKFNEEIRRSSN